MKTMLQLLVVSIITLFVSGCVQMIPLYSLNDQPVGHERSQQQVSAAINIGARAAGWRVQATEPGKILAILYIRAHEVAVDITYTETTYSINYVKSMHMKIHCSERDKLQGRTKVTGSESCTDGDQPAYIHGNYQKWIDDLNASIAVALSSS